MTEEEKNIIRKQCNTYNPNTFELSVDMNKVKELLPEVWDEVNKHLNPNH